MFERENAWGGMNVENVVKCTGCRRFLYVVWLRIGVFCVSLILNILSWLSIMTSLAVLCLQKGQFLMIFAGYVACNMNAIVHEVHMKLRQLEHV